MTEHTNNHHGKEPEIIETFKEEGVLTVETLDMASHEAANHPHRKHTTKGFTLTTPMAIIIASVIIAGGLMGYGDITTQSGNSTPKVMFTGRAIDDTDHITGKENSKVIVVEYGDPECPFCVQVSPTIKKLRTEYSSKIAFVYRYFPLTQIHSHAFDESRAIACSGVVGGSKKFYEYIDAFFDFKISNKTTQLPATGKEDIAKSVGIDVKAFTDCMNTRQTEKTISDSTNDGIAAGVQGTPSTFVLLKTRKGYEVVSMVDGARPYEYFKTVIEEALSR